MSEFKGDYSVGVLRIKAEPFRNGAQWSIVVSFGRETIYFRDQGREDIAKGRAAILASMVERAVRREIKGD